MKEVYLGVGDVARKIKNLYIGIGGTARKIVKGYIGIGGVARQFYTAIVNVAMSITNTGDSSRCYAQYNGNKYYTSGSTFTVPAGNTVILHVAGTTSSSHNSQITIDNVTVVDVSTYTATDYSWTVPNNITSASIALNNYRQYARITVTTS